MELARTLQNTLPAGSGVLAGELMMRRIYNLNALFFVLFLASSATFGAENLAISKEKFSGNFKNFTEGKAQNIYLGSESRHAEENIHYVFITGFLAFKHPGYFDAQMNAIQLLGVPKGNIHLLVPSSKMGVEQSTTWLKQELEKIPGKLVIIAHSMGAAEAFVLAMKDSDFIHDRVDDLYLLQAAIGGSPLSDILLDTNFNWKQFDHFSFGERSQLNLEWLKGQFPKYFLRQGLASMQTQVRKEENALLLHNYADSVAEISPRIHYLTSNLEDLSRYNSGVALRWKVLKQIQGENDSVVPLESQTITGVGEVALHTIADHGAFTNANSILQEEKRVALVKTIAAAVETKKTLSHPLCPWVLGNVAH